MLLKIHAFVIAMSHQCPWAWSLVSAHTRSTCSIIAFTKASVWCSIVLYVAHGDSPNLRSPSARVKETSLHPATWTVWLGRDRAPEGQRVPPRASPLTPCTLSIPFLPAMD